MVSSRLEKRLAALEGEHGLQEIGDGLCLNLSPDPDEYTPADQSAAIADWHARWRLQQTHGMFILSAESIDDFRRRLRNALGRLQDEQGTRVSVDEYVEFIHAARTTEGATDAAEYFDGMLSCEDADQVWRWTARQDTAGVSDQ